MRTVDECVSGRFSAYGEPAPETAVTAESSLVRRFLESAGRAEIEDARRDVRDLKAMTEDQAVVKVIEGRRGEASDIVASVVGTATAGLVGHALGKGLHPLAGAVPGAALTIAGFIAKQPFPIRQSLVNSGLAMIGAAWLGRDKK